MPIQFASNTLNSIKLLDHGQLLQNLKLEILKHLTLCASCAFWVVNFEARFTQCDICFHLKDAMANAPNLESKLGALVQYREHLASQYSDRTIQWALQELALDPMSNCLVAQLDGMDQAKFKLPRDPKLKATASVILFLWFSQLFCTFSTLCFLHEVLPQLPSWIIYKASQLPSWNYKIYK